MPHWVDLLFPAQCAACNALGSGLCSDCAPVRVPLEFTISGFPVRACGEYAGGLRAAVLALKDGRRDVAEALGNRLARLIEPGTKLLPVPTTARRRRVRGIDGVALMTTVAARISGACVVAALHQHAGDAQRGRDRRERLGARGRFDCDARALAACDGTDSTSVVLVDDVCTTGATLADCATAVHAAGGHVDGAVVVAATLCGKFR